MPQSANEAIRAKPREFFSASRGQIFRSDIREAENCRTKGIHSIREWKVKTLLGIFYTCARATCQDFTNIAIVLMKIDGHLRDFLRTCRIIELLLYDRYK